MRIDYPRAGKTGVRRFLPSWKQLLSLAVLAVASVVGLFALLVATTTVPEPNQVASAQTSIVYWNDGTTELGRVGEANRINVALTQVPIATQHAVLAAEDRGFYEHGGFSPAGIGRAIWNNVSGGDVQGGSTITQQYAKNAFLTQERSIKRKLNELVLSVKLETAVSKDQILEDYLNTIYFGRGAYGIQTASQAYFGKDVSKLTVSESAALAAIIRSPGGYAPDTQAEKLKGRWSYVLDGMVQQGWLTPAEKASQKFPKFVKRTSYNKYSGTNGYLLQAVLADLRNKGIGEDELNRGGYRIVSTFDKQAQAAAVKAVKDEAPSTGSKGLRIGLAAVKPGTGEVIAMYGGADYLTNSVNNATQAIGQAGSTFKPFALAAALESGVTLDSRWNGNNRTVIDGYPVTNYGDKSWGKITLLKATEQSVNAVYVGVSKDVGYDSVVQSAIRAGIPKNTPALSPVRSVALGVASPHVVDVAGAYATFAARGVQANTTVIKEVKGPNGGVLFSLDTTTTQAFTSDVADTVNYALAKVVTDGTGSRAQGLGRPAAGKTGTTNENKSAWFVGYTPQLAAAVMFVKDGSDGNPVSLSGVGGLNSVTGGSFPARIWTAFMLGALKGQPVETFISPTSIATATPTPTPTLTTATPTPTPTLTTATPTPTPTWTTATPTPTPTLTTATPTPTPTLTTATPTPTATGPTPVPTASP